MYDIKCKGKLFILSKDLLTYSHRKRMTSDHFFCWNEQPFTGIDPWSNLKLSAVLRGTMVLVQTLNVF